ncbi:hypothetical protein RB597_003052 [Gaeumannomyces tritici]
MAGAAATQFGQMRDLLRCVGDHIRNKTQLRRLCLVSKVFNGAFTPALYSEMEIVTREDERENFLNAIASNPHLHHVRRLQCNFSHPGPVNDLVRSLVERMPQLQEFEWDGGCLHQETMSALIRSCPELKAFVTIFVPGQPSGCEEPVEFGELDEAKAGGEAIEDDTIVAGMRHLARFAGLTKLTVGEMYEAPVAGTEGRWAEDIVEILLACPDLEELTLSFSEHCIEDSQGAFDRGCGEFFRLVCLNYKKRAARPLRLKVLRIGLGVILRRDPATKLVPQDISGLTDLCVLEELYVDCRKTSPFGNHGLEEGLGARRIPWDLFTPDSAPSLARVGLFPCPRNLDYLPVPLFSLLQLPPDSELHQSEVRRRPPSQNNQVTLRLWAFAAVAICPSIYTRNVGFISSTIKTHRAPVASVMVAAHEGSLPDTNEAWEAYMGLASKASSVFLQATVRDPRDGLTYQEQLEAMLARTPGLRVLVVGAPWVCMAQPFRHSTVEQIEARAAANSEHNRLASSLRWRKALARRLAETGRGLRIVKIGRHAWRVQRGVGDVGADQVTLLSMDRYEQRHLENFRPPSHLYPEFVMFGICSSLGQRHEYEAMMR